MRLCSVYQPVAARSSEGVAGALTIGLFAVLRMSRPRGCPEGGCPGRAAQSHLTRCLPAGAIRVVG